MWGFDVELGDSYGHKNKQGSFGSRQSAVPD